MDLDFLNSILFCMQIYLLLYCILYAYFTIHVIFLFIFFNLSLRVSLSFLVHKPSRKQPFFNRTLFQFIVIVHFKMFN